MESIESKAAGKQWNWGKYEEDGLWLGGELRGLSDEEGLAAGTKGRATKREAYGPGKIVRAKPLNTKVSAFRRPPAGSTSQVSY
jgi:hypothetical protein